MRARIIPCRYSGIVKIPSSKSHTIRQLLIASLADGVSEIVNPLVSLDSHSCVNVCRAFGTEITEYPGKWVVDGNAGFKKKGICEAQVDVGNSGTTLYLALAVAALQDKPVEFIGDEQIQARSAAPLLEALTGLGVQCKSNNGCAPITVQGPWKGGKVRLPCPTSQYLSAILIAAPLAPADIVTEIDVPLLNEKPYVEITLSYLREHEIPYEISPDYSRVVIKGGASWKPFSSLPTALRPVPGDFSSAAFPAAAAAITGGPVSILGLDPEDTQGDKYFMTIIKEMGCEVEWVGGEHGKMLTVSRKGLLKGGTFDLNETPDILPAAAVVAAYAHGDTSLVNVAHARIKETDRIAVMAKELAKLGVSCTEREDGLIIHGQGGSLAKVNDKNPVVLDGHGDHRVVMALAVAALGGQNTVEITSAESAAVTYPGFLDMIQSGF